MVTLDHHPLSMFRVVCIKKLFIVFSSFVLCFCTVTWYTILHIASVVYAGSFMIMITITIINFILSSLKLKYNRVDRYCACAKMYARAALIVILVT